MESAVQCTNTPNDQDTCEKLGCCFNTSCYHSDGVYCCIDTHTLTFSLIGGRARELCLFYACANHKASIVLCHMIISNDMNLIQSILFCTFKFLTVLTISI